MPNNRIKVTAAAFMMAFCCIVTPSCRPEASSPAGPSAGGVSPARLILTADVTTGSIPLTVNFTGTLQGYIDTLYTRVPEISLEGGYNPEESLYTPSPDTVTPGRSTYTGREHYFRQGTFNAVMILHGLHGDIRSDTVLITVH
jgi:hypothetical protein